MYAAESNENLFYGNIRQMEVTNILIKAKARLDLRTTKSGMSVIHYAAAYGSPHGIDILLKAGCDIEDRDKQGATPLMWAAAGRKESNAKALFNAGANPWANDQDGKTAVEWAVDDDLKEWLKDKMIIQQKDALLEVVEERPEEGTPTRKRRL